MKGTFLIHYATKIWKLPFTIESIMFLVLHRKLSGEYGHSLLFDASILSFLLKQQMIFLKLMKVNFQGPSLVWALSKTFCLVLSLQFVIPLLNKKVPSNFISFRLHTTCLLGGVWAWTSGEDMLWRDYNPFSTSWQILHSLVEIMSELSLLTSSSYSITHL